MPLRSSFYSRVYLVFFGLLLFSWSVFAFASDNNKGNIFLDSDQDGLSDDEEVLFGTDPKNPDTDGDSYSDGVEVESGYDPKVPAPGDRLNVDVSSSSTSASNGDRENLTEQVSLQIAELLTSQESDEPLSEESLQDIVDGALDASLDYSDLPPISEDDIIVLKRDYKKLSDEERAVREREDILTYLTTVSYIIASNSPQDISSYEGLLSMRTKVSSKFDDFSSLGSPGSISYFVELGEQGERVLEQLKQVEVPVEMLDIHIRGMQIAQYAVKLRDSVRPDDNDPLRMISGLSQAQSLISLSSVFFTDVMTHLSDLGVTSDSPLISNFIGTAISSDTTDSVDSGVDDSDSDVVE
ncbi:MAG: hypothetical protein KC736_02880 [Candidatus Moranbacteria bacterium]|nr:hypothetical protein [Candidatus Moranbacteria bacterium]